MSSTRCIPLVGRRSGLGHMIIDINSQITTHFAWKEALCLKKWELCAIPHDQQTYENIIKTANKLEEIRSIWNKPIIVTSWYRPRSYNTHIGGAMQSGHMFGMAVDFQVHKVDCYSARQVLRSKLEPLNIRMENKIGANWIHIDTKTPSQPGRRFFKP